MGSEIHKALRLCALERGITVSKLVDELLCDTPEIRIYLAYEKKIKKTIQRKLSKQLYEKTEKEGGVFEKLNAEGGA